MNIRTITGGFDLNNRNAIDEYRILNFFKYANKLFLDTKRNVRTNRITIPPININYEMDGKDVLAGVEAYSKFCSQNGIRWFCVPIDTFENNMPKAVDVSINILKKYNNTFVSHILSKNNSINKHGIIHSAKLIRKISKLSNNGYDNFRFGASFNCRPNTPFFPYSYHGGGNKFSIALEMIPVIINAIRNNGITDVSEVRDVLVETLSEQIKEIDNICKDIEHKTQVGFSGIDISLAPFPTERDNSVGQLIELIGAEKFGNASTLFFVGYLTNILKTIINETGIKPTGFNGVMFSLLEDNHLGRANDSHGFSIDSLISYSAICGCGIDMVPVPGDIFEEEIGSLMLDIASISNILSKPLGVRLLPIPMKRENEFTDFSHDFLHNTRILSVKNGGCNFDIFNKEKNNFSFLSTHK